MSRFISSLIVLTLACQLQGAAKSTASAYIVPDPARVAEIAAMLPDQPAGVGRPITDRAAWDKLAATDHFKAIIKQADEHLKQPIPDQPDELFLMYTKNGDRTAWQKVAFDRRSRFARLVMAECAQNQGRYLDKIRQVAEALCAETTWVYSAHDGKLDNFNGKVVDIDLGSSALCWQMATASWLLGEKLDAATRKLIRENVDRRSNKPFLDSLAGGRRFGWATATHNWNAVCIAGTVGTALATIDDKAMRATFIAAAEKANERFLAGFTDDGYCSEGLGYWNYGFGHFVLLTETVKQATAGKIDFLSHPRAKAPATFALNIQIINEVAPAFADCGVYPKPGPHTMWYLNRRFGLGQARYETLEVHATRSYLFEEMLYRCENTMTAVAPIKQAAKESLRSWFDAAGILISRPASGGKFGVALKGGHNAEHHNHNDVGSYVVVVGDKCVLLDPGPETYTRRTFSAQRYDSKLLNSYGHPVPVVAGELQKPGRQSAAKIIKTDFTDAADTLAMDITSCYAVKDLKQLDRTFIHSRTGAGSLTITDRVAFSSPQTFGTALITLGKCTQQADGSLLLEDGKQAVVVTIDAGKAKWTLKTEEIIEKASVKPTRIGIDLTDKISEAQVVITIKPK